MQKGSVLPLLLGILVLGGIIGTYLFFNKPTPPPLIRPIEQKNNLKTYQQEKLGFQFQYTDKDLKVQEDSEEEFNKRGNGDFRKNFTYYVTYQPADVLGAVSVLDESGSYEMNPFTVWVFNNANNLTIEQFYEKYWYYPFVWGDYTERRENVAPINDATISGQLAKYGVVTYREGSPKFVYLSSNGKMYLIRIINNEDNIGDQILSTFKFQ